MKLIRNITAFILCAVMLLSFASCDKTDPYDGFYNETQGSSDDIGEIGGKYAADDYSFDVNADTAVTLHFLGKDGMVSRIKVESDGHSDTVINLFEMSYNVLMDDRGVAYDGSEGQIKLIDINTDGNMDFLIKAWDDKAYTPYYSFMWNDEDCSFVYLGVLGDPYVELTTGKIYSSVVSDGEEAVYVYSLGEFALKKEASWAPASAPVFDSDLSAYEQYMAPADRDAYLTLVNSANTLDESYVPDNLYGLVDTKPDRARQQMVLDAAMSMEAMFIEMRTQGYNDMWVMSGYRDYAYQSELFASYVQEEIYNRGCSEEEAEKYASVYSARPGTSEHQTGLCCDIHNLPEADQSFAEKRVFKWLEANCWKFGYVLRYPEGKEAVTSIEFEPWHYRFVGRYHADKMHSLGMCLEEYIVYNNAIKK